MSHMVETRGAPGDPMDALGASGRAERQLIENLGTEVFETAVQHGWIDEDDAAFAAGTPRGAALKLLTDIGLLRFDERARRFHPVDPSAANDQLVVPLAQRGSELFAESARWNQTFSRLGQVYRSSSVGIERAITEVHGFEAINRFIDTQ